MPDRNPKVRRRLAAGKLRLRLCDLRNLGPRSVNLLGEIGIHTPEELRRRGALEVYLDLRRSGAVRSLNLLWALVGAIEPWPEGRDWREVAASKARLPLLLAVEQRESARGETWEAGQALQHAQAKQDAQSDVWRAGEVEDSLESVTPWVPGLPFEPPVASAARQRRPKKKNRR